MGLARCLPGIGYHKCGSGRPSARRIFPLAVLQGKQGRARLFTQWLIPCFFPLPSNRPITVVKRNQNPAGGVRKTLQLGKIHKYQTGGQYYGFESQQSNVVVWHSQNHSKALGKAPVTTVIYLCIVKQLGGFAEADQESVQGGKELREHR